MHPAPRSTRTVILAVLAVLAALASLLAIALTPVVAQADTDLFRDRRDDVSTPNDIRWLRVNYDDDLNVTYKLKGLPRGEVYLWIDVGGSPRPEYVWYGTLGDRAEDFAFYHTRNWTSLGDEIDCGFDYTRNRENNTVRLEIGSDCFDTDYDGLRVSAATTYWNRRTDTYINPDYAPARRAWYPFTDNN